MGESRPEYTDGDLLVDTRTNEVGEYKGMVGFSDKIKRRVWLRPLGGGIEWDVPPNHVRRASDGEALSAKTAAVNAASRNRPRP